MSRSALRAPRQHGGILADPPLAEAADLWSSNRLRFDSTSATILGRPLNDLRRQARQAALQIARDYFTANHEPIPPLSDSAGLLVAGHQPELFHPGVWVKNFALQGLARKLGAISLNLIIDHDLVKSTMLRLPNRDRIAQIAIDHGRADVPYEDRTIADEAFFAALPERCEPFLATWPFRPLLPSFWPRHGSVLLGERLAAARRAVERSFGCWQLEVPFSRLCRTEPFAWFVVSLLSEGPRLWRIYHDVIRAYRKAQGIKSRSHPVPDLGQDGDWLEMPLWAWRAREPRRRRVFSRPIHGGFELRAGQESWGLFHGPAQEQVGAWLALETAGQKVRPRALSTTGFARLLLGDLFLHGLGGGIYDQLTDEIWRQFFGLEPPAYLILSATLLLPFSRTESSAETARRSQRLERDLWWNPQRYLPGTIDQETRVVGQEKQAWIDRIPTTGPERHKRFHELRRLTEALRPWTEQQRHQAREAVAAAKSRWQEQATLGRRDYAFCLYPEDMLRSFYQRFLQ